MDDANKAEQNLATQSTEMKPTRELSADSSDLITVCDHCLQASCWQAIFFCDYAQSAGTVQKTRAELAALDREHSSYWKTDAELAAL